jgi:hypothetical protein
MKLRGQGRAGHAPEKDAGSANSSAIRRTEDALSCRPGRTGRPRLHSETSCKGLREGCEGREGQGIPAVPPRHSRATARIAASLSSESLCLSRAWLSIAMRRRRTERYCDIPTRIARERRALLDCSAGPAPTAIGRDAKDGGAPSERARSMRLASALSSGSLRDGGRSHAGAHGSPTNLVCRASLLRRMDCRSASIKLPTWLSAWMRLT